METTGSARKKNLLSTLKVAGVFTPLCKFELLTLRQNKKFICFKLCSLPCLRSDIPSLIKCILNFTDVLNLSVVYFASKAVESPLSQLKLSVHFFYILQKPFISLGPVLSWKSQWCHQPLDLKNHLFIFSTFSVFKIFTNSKFWCFTGFCDPFSWLCKFR